MKWFTHDCDMHTDLRIQQLIEKEGLEGYAIYNLCLEFLGKEGKKGRLKVDSRWQQGLLKVCGWSDKGRLDKVLNTIASVGLICPKSLKYGNLYCKNFMKRADNWTKRVLRSNSGVTQEKVPVQYNTLQYIILHYIKEQGWSVDKESPLFTNYYKRACKPAKELYLALGDKEKACEIITRARKYYTSKKLDWALETILRHLPKFLAEPKDEIKWL